MEGSAVSSDAKMADSPEESSWTFYIQGFLCDNDDDKNSSFSSEFESPSLVSDAASSVMDYDLEDTASSPVNSPKQVSYVNQFMNQKDKAKMDVSEGKRNSFAKGGDFAVERDTNYTDLKKRTCG